MMTIFVFYLLISGIGFPVTLGILIKQKKSEGKEEFSNESNN